MKKLSQLTLVRVMLTLTILVITGILAYLFWRNYTDRPFTRQGHVRAFVVSLAPEVTGRVTAVNVVDNQAVKADDVLFVIDQEPYRIALERARASYAAAQARYEQMQASAARRANLDAAVISKEAKEDAMQQAKSAAAEVQVAKAALNSAELNMRRTEVRSPVDGFVTNLDVRKGNFLSDGHPVVAVVDRNSYYLEAYFEETMLRNVRPGDKVSVELLSGGGVFEGKVMSIAYAIQDSDTAQRGGLLSSVDPTYSWIRLAQRVPVKISLSELPKGVQIVAGMTATVQVHSSNSNK